MIRGLSCFCCSEPFRASFKTAIFTIWGNCFLRFLNALGVFDFSHLFIIWSRHSARRKSAFPHAMVRRLGRRRRDRSGVPFLRGLSSCSSQDVSERQSASEIASGLILHAPCGSVLDDRPEFTSRAMPLAGHCFCPCPRRVWRASLHLTGSSARFSS